MFPHRGSSRCIVAFAIARIDLGSVIVLGAYLRRLSTKAAIGIAVTPAKTSGFGTNVI